MEFKVNTSKEAGDFLVGAARRAAQGGRSERDGLAGVQGANGAVSIADGNSTIAVQRLTDLNAALIKAKTERINKEALYNQLSSMQTTGTIDTLPGGARQRLHPGAEDEPRAGPARSRRSSSERYGDDHPEMIKAERRSQSADAKLSAEIGKVVEGGQQRVPRGAGAGAEPAGGAQRPAQ